jgi:hypothetical protein
MKSIFLRILLPLLFLFSSKLNAQLISDEGFLKGNFIQVGEEVLPQVILQDLELIWDLLRIQIEMDLR